MSTPSVPQPAEEIAIVVAMDEQDGGTKKGWFTSDEPEVRAVPVPVLQRNLAALSKSVVSALTGLKAVGDFSLTEVTLQVEVGAEGGVALIGTSKVSGKGAITLKFQK